MTDKAPVAAPSETAPVTKVRAVTLAPEAAFELFTVRMGEWWPLPTHSIAEADAVGIRFEPRLGGSVVELTRDGDEWAWAEVLEWDPPHRFVLSWHPNPAPTAASTLEVRFTAAGDGTQVTLTHSGWEVFGARAAQLRQNYDSGWDTVLRGLEQSAGR